MFKWFSEWRENRRQEKEKKRQEDLERTRLRCSCGSTDLSDAGGSNWGFRYYLCNACSTRFYVDVGDNFGM